MVLGLLGVIGIATAVPSVIGVAEGVKAQKNADREAKLSKKCNLLVYCEARSSKAKVIHKKPVWLCNDKLYISEGPPARLNLEDPGHAFEGFYIEFPRPPKNPMGMVSMSSKSPPALGWIYVDRDTREVKYGNKTTSMPHIVGRWGWTEDEIGVVLNSKREMFVAVEEEDDMWAVYWDRKGDGAGLPEGKKVLEISMERQSIEEEKEEPKNEKKK